MKLDITVDKFGSFVASHARDHVETGHGLTGPAVTIAHQTGAGSHDVGKVLAQLLHESEPPGAQEWTVLDRQIVEKALEEHHLPAHLLKRMPEDRRSYLEDVFDELFGLRPPSWVLVPQVAETMRHLARAGHVILIGRGATVVTSKLPNVFHVRLVASLATRIDHVRETMKLDAKAAAEFVEKEDLGRERYVRANFHAQVNDALLYHMVINTDFISYADAAAIIAEGARKCFKNFS